MISAAGLKEIGPNFVGLKIMPSCSAPICRNTSGNTLLMWIIRLCAADCRVAAAGGLVPGHAAAPARLGLFKTVIYMPNLIMASAFAMLFSPCFSDNGPVNAALVSAGFLEEPFRFYPAWQARAGWWA